MGPASISCLAQIKVLKEGEKPFLGLVKAEDKLKYFETAKGWITREKLKRGKPIEIDFIIDLDEIPFLRYDLIDLEPYQKKSRYHGDKKNIKQASIFLIDETGVFAKPPKTCAIGKVTFK